MTPAIAETPAPVTHEAFPMETLPAGVRQFVSCHARALPVAPDLLALSVLTTIGAAIGNPRRIRLWGDWEETALIYGAIVADSGAMKTPALKRATHPYVTRKFDDRETWTTDVTKEKLGLLLADNTHGIYLVHDELTSLVKSLDQYKAGGKGSERQFYLSAWACSPTKVDRVGSASFQVDHPYLSIIGNIPPDQLPELIKASSHGDGFIQRFLFAWPKPEPVVYTDATVPESVKQEYQRLIERLLTLDGSGKPKPEPVVLPLTSEAKACFIEWYNVHGKRMETETPLLMQFDSKLKAYCARLALIHAMASDPDAVEVGLGSIEAAILQITYFRTQAHRVVALLSVGVGASVPGVESKAEIVQRAIIRAVERGNHNKREIQRTMNNCKADVFNNVWDSMLRPKLTQIGEGLYSLTDTDIPTKVIPWLPTPSTIDQPTVGDGRTTE